MAEIKEETESPPFELKDILYAVMRSWVLIGILATGGLAAGIYQAASKANYYQSRAKLLLRVGAREKLNPEDAAGASTSRGREFSTGIEDEIHMLTGQALYARLAERIGPAEILAPADPTRYVSEDMLLPKRLFHKLQAALAGMNGDNGGSPGGGSVPKATQRLMKKTIVRAERYSNVISVFHTSSSPEKAQAHCQAIVDAFIERHSEQYSAARFVADSKKRVDEADRKYKEAEADFWAHIGECKNDSVATQLEDLTRDITERQEEIFDSKIRRDEIAVEIRQLRRRLEATPPTVETLVPAVKRPNEEHEAARQLKNEWIVEKEKILFDNSLTLATRDKQIARYEEKIEEQDRLLESLDPEVVVQEARIDHAPNEDYEEIESRLSDLEIEDMSLVEKLENLAEHVEEQLATKTKMLDCKFVHQVKSSKMEDLERIYDQHADKHAQYLALASIDEEGKTNLAVLEPPNLPSGKTGPSRTKLVLVGLMGGVMAGVGLALLRQFLDPKLRHPHAVERALSVPLIAVVPERKAVRLLRKASAAKPATAG